MTPQHVSSEAMRLVDDSGLLTDGMALWSPVKFEKEVIDEQIELLAEGELPEGGRRVAHFIHPESPSGPEAGLAPGIRVSVEVLKPGESTTPVRQNAALIQLGLQGRGAVEVAGTSHEIGKYDMATVPAMRPYRFRNTGDELWVRLTYSNAPVLARLGVHMVENLDAMPTSLSEMPAETGDPHADAPDITVNDEGARLQGYEQLTNPVVLENRPLIWRFDEVIPHLSTELGDGKRPLLAYYNSATERRCGATHSLFFTIARFPDGTPIKTRGPGHRHTSSAINYHWRGSGSSVVEGQELSWKPGDLLLSAPGWSEHNHFWGGPDGFGSFTVQDHPLHIGMESLVWQEEMDGPLLTPGSEAGLTGYIGPRTQG